MQLLPRNWIIRIALAAGIALALSSAGPRTSLAQTGAGGRNEIFAGSVLESYLRYLQTLGKSTTRPISIRGFSPQEIDSLSVADSAHPWAQRYELAKQPRSGLVLDYIRPKVDVAINTAFPYESNDGAGWRGKGLTTAAQAGVSVRWGPLSAVLAPVFFRAENSTFPLLSNDSTTSAFADGLFPRIVDRPQKFGATPYQRFDLGESTLRLDLRGIAAGVSTASQWWGPTNDFPFVLGNNAGGFPHAFLGTSGPANIGIGTIHGRVVYGYLSQSPYSSVTGTKYIADSLNSGTARFMAGMVAVIQIRGVPGLELGGSRFFHAGYEKGGITAQRYGLPFQNLLKSRISQSPDSAFGGSPDAGENQLASLFFRWAPPGSGFDVYGEYGRDDHSSDIRDLLLEPDHAAASNLGFRYARLSPTALTAIRAEAFQYGELRNSADRFEGFIYTHATLRQGHTSRGQLLAADVGPGSGSAQTLAVDRFTSQGRMTGYVRRVVQKQAPSALIGADNSAAIKVADVMSTMGGEVTRFIGPLDVTARAALTFNLNRNFGKDQTNGTLGITVRQSF